MLGIIWRISLLLLALTAVLADTEIRNFRVPLAGEPVQPTSPIIELAPNDRRTLIISHKQPELWLALGADTGAWTARLSWQASTPTRFDMEVYPADEGKGALLHVRARPLSPRIRQPWHLLDRLDFFNLLDHADLVLENPIVKRLGLAASREKAEEVLADDEFETPFHVILEPLVLGVLPRTAVPAVLAILVMLVGAGLAAPRVAAALERLAVQVKVEKEE